MVDLDDEEKEHLEAAIAWLEANGPDDWHRVALDFNWGEPLYLLDWIVRQDECDVATALTIFWQGEPEAWIEEDPSYPGDEPNGFSYLNKQMCIAIANRVLAGGYTRSEIAFQPTTWTKKSYVDLVAKEATLEQPNFRTGPALIRSRTGRAVDLNADFYRRYPEEFHHSYLDQALSDDLERGAYETPRSVELMATVDDVERKTLEALPDWVRENAPLADTPTTSPVPPPVAPPPVPPSAPPPPPAPPRPAGNDASEQASSRVRAMRHREPTEEDVRPADGGSGLGAWIRRLFGK